MILLTQSNLHNLFNNLKNTPTEQFYIGEFTLQNTESEDYYFSSKIAIPFIFKETDSNLTLNIEFYELENSCEVIIRANTFLTTKNLCLDDADRVVIYTIIENFITNSVLPFFENKEVLVSFITDYTFLPHKLTKYADKKFKKDMVLFEENYSFTNFPSTSTTNNKEFIFFKNNSRFDYFEKRNTIILKTLNIINKELSQSFFSPDRNIRLPLTSEQISEQIISRNDFNFNFRWHISNQVLSFSLNPDKEELSVFTSNNDSAIVFSLSNLNVFEKDFSAFIIETIQKSEISIILNNNNFHFTNKLFLLIAHNFNLWYTKSKKQHSSIEYLYSSIEKTLYNENLKIHPELFIKELLLENNYSLNTLDSSSTYTGEFQSKYGVFLFTIKSNKTSDTLEIQVEKRN